MRNFHNVRDSHGRFTKKDDNPVKEHCSKKCTCSNDDWTEVVFLVDRSGSMSGCARNMEKEFQSYVNEQCNEKSGEMTVTIYTFDGGGLETICVRVPVQTRPQLRIVPRGMTPLYDSIAETIDRTELLHRGEKPGRTIFVCVTDGLENASRRHSRYSIGMLVKKKTNIDFWQFVFIGANQDAVLEGSKFGISQNSALSFDTDESGIRNMYASLSKGTSDKRKMSRRDYEESTTMGLFFQE